MSIESKAQQAAILIAGAIHSVHEAIAKIEAIPAFADDQLCSDLVGAHPALRAVESQLEEARQDHKERSAL